MRADFRLGDWTISPRHDCIERGEEVVHIHPRPKTVLECRAAHLVGDRETGLALIALAVEDGTFIP